MPIATHKTIIYKTPELNQTTYEAIKSYITRKDSKENTGINFCDDYFDRINYEIFVEGNCFYHRLCP